MGVVVWLFESSILKTGWLFLSAWKTPPAINLLGADWTGDEPLCDAKPKEFLRK